MRKAKDAARRNQFRDLHGHNGEPALAKAEQNRAGVTINQKLVDSTVGNSGSGS